MSRMPPPEYRFKPGQSGNPGGRPKAKITIDRLREIIEKLAFLTRDELQELIANPKTVMIELQFASIMAQAAKSGDYSRMSFILDRVVGKVAEFKDPLKDVRDEIESMSRDDLIKQLEDTLTQLKAS